ncbi:MAG: tetratricopeptide repeat protein [Rhodospirillales bacterium]
MNVQQRIRAQLPLIAAPLAIFIAFGSYKWAESADERGTITIWSTDYYFQRGLTAQQADNNDRAIYEYNRALTRDPDNALAHMALATVFAGRGDTAKARPEADQAVQAAEYAWYWGPAPSFRQRDTRRDTLYRTLSYRAQLADAGGDRATAERDLNKVVELDGRYGNEHVWALVRLARIALAHGEFDAAHGHLKRLLDDSPDNTVYRFERASINFAAGNEQDALRDLTFVIERAADAMQSMFIIDRGAAAMGFVATASPFNEILSVQAVRRAWIESLAIRAKIYLLHGDTAAAKSDLDAAAKLAPDRADIGALRASLGQ